MIARALRWDARGSASPTLLSGGCRAWPVASWTWPDWRNALGGRRTKLESPGRVGGVAEWGAVLSILESTGDVPWSVSSRIDFPERQVFGVLPAVDFLDFIEPEVAPRLRWIRAGGAGTQTAPEISVATHLWVALFRGTKRWAFWPRARGAEPPSWPAPLVLEQRAGDVIVVPAGIWYAHARVSATIEYVRQTIDADSSPAAITACIRGGALDLADRLVRVAREASWRSVTDPERTPVSGVRPRL